MTELLSTRAGLSRTTPGALRAALGPSTPPPSPRASTAAKPPSEPAPMEELGRRFRAFLADTGLYREGVDNVSGPAGTNVGRSLDTAEEALAFFDRRLQGATAFLAERGLEGRVVAKLVTSDLTTLLGRGVLEHVEWQLFLVPARDVDGAHTDERGVLFLGRGDHAALPGLLDEERMTEWVKGEIGTAGLLRSADNPLFLGRLNLGEGGMGMFTGVPEYAEVHGQRFRSREWLGMMVLTLDQAQTAIRAGYDRLPGEWGEHGTCQQGAMVTAEALGLEVGTVARNIHGLWLTRFKYGRTGNARR